MTFEEALEYIRALENQPDYVNCETYSVFSQTQSTIFSEVSFKHVLECTLLRDFFSLVWYATAGRITL